MTTKIKKVTLKSLKGENTQVDPTKGTVTNPFTQEEYNSLCNTGEWPGGYVETMGYVAPPMMDGMSDGSGSGSDDTENSIVSKARTYLGKNENDDTDLILSWLSAVGITSTTYVIVDEVTGESKTKVTEPWCASFVSAVYRESVGGGANSARVSDWATWGHSVKNPQPGDVAIFEGVSHCAIVVNATSDTVSVIYGNSGLDNVTDSTIGRQGFKDFRRK